MLPINLDYLIAKTTRQLQIMNREQLIAIGLFYLISCLPSLQGVVPFLQTEGRFLHMP